MPGPAHVFQVVLGLVIWSVWFVAVYAGLSVGCAVAAPDPAAGAVTWLNGTLLLLTLLTTLLLAFWARRCWRVSVEAQADSMERFVTRIAAVVHGVSAASTLAVGLPIIVYPPCV